MQNIKVDIVYYMSNTDFEMEFNLCGCCRMRLLTNKADDKKELISGLSKAVDRSRVIIVCGAMFGEEGLTKIISTALGAEMQTLNNAECGIDFEGEINIINGATPLVTPEGVFGGFIIESGPQSIIVLTDNKDIRKKLMNNLVHEYIEELSFIPVESVTNPQPAIDTKENETVAQETEDGENIEAPEEETVLENGEDIKEQSEQIPEEKVEENSDTEENSENVEEEIKDEPKAEETSKEEHNISFVDKNGAPLENAETELYINPQKAKRKKNSYYEYYVPSKDNELFVAGVQDDDATRKPSKPHSLNIPIIIILCLLLIIVFVAAYFLIGIPLLSGKDITSYVSNIFAESSSVI